jgi:sigma-B regulation protein RsbU (phosphoserine phosphatase)
MRTLFNKIKIGGLQQKIFNLVLITMLVLVGTFAGVSAYQQQELSKVVRQANLEQQASMEAISQQTMADTLNSLISRTTALQAYIADELFADVRADVLTLQTFAAQLFIHEGSFAPGTVAPPSAENEGTPTAQLISEEGADPASSPLLGTVAHMQEIMLAMYGNSDRMSSVFVGTADGHMVLVNDRPGVFISEDGSVKPLEVRQRPWYRQAAEAGQLIFTGVETDAYTDNPMLECAAPVYRNGELVAVVAADIYLTSISDYVESTATEGGFLCVINQQGQVLFSPVDEGVFRAEMSDKAEDLRLNENSSLAAFIARALNERTPMELMTISGREYYLAGAPLDTLGWTVISVVEKEVTDQPTLALLSQYEEINQTATASYEQGAARTFRMFVILTSAVLVLAIISALILASRVVKPLEKMTVRINSISSDDPVFRMDDAYRTGDEIEILAESFADISAKSQEYIQQITQITAEKERIGTELALATRIQADMLPNIFPPFPDRPEFDLYASMDPAREVGGDFYDYFLVDDDHLCLVMADVSGKGVPAALFMMASKIILANNAMMGKSPARILTDANASICKHNREEMFVTVWLGILEISTGILTAANAGHEYPALKAPDGAYELYKDRHGFVIGGMDGVKYKEYQLELRPGSKLFLYTDGVPEATDSGKQMFGTGRMLDALNADPGADPASTLKNVRAAVDGFVKDAEQFDDLTMLCLEYRGAASKVETA